MKQIERLSDPQCRRPAKPWQADGNGLWLRSGSDGDTRRQKTLSGQVWVYRFVSPVTGKPRKFVIGQYPLVTLKQAREERDKLALQVKAKIDPTEQKQAARKASVVALEAAKLAKPPVAAPQPVETFAGLAKRFLADKAQGWRGEYTLSAFNRRVDRVMAVVGNKPPLQIDTADVLKIVRPLFAEYRLEGMETRNAMRRVIGYGLAEQHLPQTSNPAIWKGHLEYLLTSNAETVSYPAVPWIEAPALWQKLLSVAYNRPPASTPPSRFDNTGYDKGYDNYDFHKAALKAVAWMLATGSRGIEARRLQWDWIDLDERIVRYPANAMKNGRPWWQPLNAPAMILLEGQRAMLTELPRAYQAGSTPAMTRTGHVFPALTGGQLNDAVPWEAFKLIDPDHSPHALRSALRMWLADVRLDCPDYVAEAAIAHQFGSKTQRAYQQSLLCEAKRPFMNAWGEFLVG